MKISIKREIVRLTKECRQTMGLVEMLDMKDSSISRALLLQKAEETKQKAEKAAKLLNILERGRS